MIVDDECTSIPFNETRSGDVWRCPQTQDWYMTTTLAGDGMDGTNCVRLSDGKLMNRAEEWTVDFFRGARLVVP